MVELESVRTETGDARMVTAGPLPTTALITANDIAPGRTTGSHQRAKVGTDGQTSPLSRAPGANGRLPPSSHEATCVSHSISGTSIGDEPEFATTATGNATKRVGVD